MNKFFKPVPIQKKYFESEGQAVHYQKGQMFVRPEDENPWVYYLADGLVEIAQAIDDGNNRLIGYFFPGAVFAQSGSFLDINGSGLEYIAVKNSSLLRIKRERFFRIISEDIDFSNEYIEILLRNQFLLMERIAFMGESNIDRKVIKLIIGLANYYGHQNGELYQVDIPVTQEVIARFTHSTRESASKTIRRLTRSKIISINNKVLTVLNMVNLYSELDN